MSGKLILLNLILVGVLAYGSFTVRNHWKSEKARETATLNHSVPPAAPPPMTLMPPLRAVLPSGYLDVATNMLFDRSRNSEVVIEPPPVPPPVPVPPLPVYHGQMNIGEPIVILSVNATAQGQAVRVGEQIGPFKLVDFNIREIALEWNGQVIHKTVDEISQPPNVVKEVPQERTAQPILAAVAQVQRPATSLGQDMEAAGIKTCIPTDNTPEGTVVDGFRKVLKPGPFGTTCLWEPAH